VGSKKRTLLELILEEFSCEFKGKFLFLCFLASLICYFPNKIAVVGRESAFVPNLKSFPTSRDLFEIMMFSDLSNEFIIFTRSTNGKNYRSNQQVLSISSLGQFDLRLLLASHSQAIGNNLSLLAKQFLTFNV